MILKIEMSMLLIYKHTGNIAYLTYNVLKYMENDSVWPRAITVIGNDMLLL